MRHSEETQRYLVGAKKLSRTQSRTQHCSCGGVDFDISAEDRERLAEKAAGIDPVSSGRPESRLSTGIADGDRLHMW
jgi:hypothetical protein